MSIIQKSGRDMVVFDVNNKQHRELFYSFMKNRTWGKSPIRFFLEEEYGDLISMIKEKLCLYYVDKEFKKKGV